MMSREGRGREGEEMSKMMDQWLQKGKPGYKGRPTLDSQKREESLEKVTNVFME
jgi:hypothetical protein